MEIIHGHVIMPHPTSAVVQRKCDVEMELKMVQSNVIQKTQTKLVGEMEVVMLLVSQSIP